MLDNQKLIEEVSELKNEVTKMCTDFNKQMKKMIKIVDVKLESKDN